MKESENGVKDFMRLNDCTPAPRSGRPGLNSRPSPMFFVDFLQFHNATDKIVP
jgi:hypothetical protein